jgi:hypothetical protein
MDSNGHVPYLVEVDIGHALRCTPSLDRSCKLTQLTSLLADDQVFYGRYLRKLSNLTQEAVGEMSKVNFQLLIVGFELISRLPRKS